MQSMELNDLVWYMPNARSKLFDFTQELGVQEYIGVGSTSIVFRKGDNVLKLPRITKPSDEICRLLSKEEKYDTALKQFRRDNQENYDAAQNEKAAFVRAGEHPNLVRYVNVTGPGLELSYLRGGDVAAHMETVYKSAHLIPRVRWILQLASAVVHLHRHRIAHHHLSLQCLLLDSNLDLHLAGLSHAFICDTNLGTIYNPKNDRDPTADQTETVQMDIYDFGWLLYAIMGWRGHYTRPEERWSSLEHHPETDHLPAGNMMKRCWTWCGYGSMEKVLEELKVVFTYACPSMPRRELQAY